MIPAAAISVADLPSTLWRNGGGETRTVAAASRGAEPAWRISIATVANGAGFSSFPGYERALIPLVPDRVTLHDAAGPITPDHDGIMRFDGSAEVTSQVRHAATQVVNVMTLPGHRAEFRWRTVTGEYMAADARVRAVVVVGGMVAAGSAEVSVPAVLRSGGSVRCVDARLLEIHITS